MSRRVNTNGGGATGSRSTGYEFSHQYSNPRGGAYNYSNDRNPNPIGDSNDDDKNMMVSNSTSEEERGFAANSNNNNSRNGGSGRPAAAKQIRFDSYENSHNSEASNGRNGSNQQQPKHSMLSNASGATGKSSNKSGGANSSSRRGRAYEDEQNNNVTIVSGTTVSRTTASPSQPANNSQQQQQRQQDRNRRGLSEEGANRPRPPTKAQTNLVDDDEEDEEDDDDESTEFEETTTDDDFVMPPNRRGNHYNPNTNRNNNPYGGNASIGIGFQQPRGGDNNGGGDDDGTNASSEGCNGRLYDLLQTEPDVPAYEIQQLFARTRLRQQYREAYRVLGNGDKKRLYDIIGEPVVETLNKSWGDVVEVLGSTVACILYGFALLSTVLCLFLFTTFLPVHVDGRHPFTWHGVHTPLYVLFVLAVAAGLFLFAISCLAKNSAKLGFRHSLGRLVVAAGYTAFVFIVGSTLHDGKSREWMPVFVILIIVDCVTILEWMTWSYPKRIRALFLSYKVDNPNAGGGNGGGNITNNGDDTNHNSLSQLTNNSRGNTSSQNLNGQRSGGGNGNRKPSSGLWYQSLVWGFTILGLVDFILAIIRYIFIGLKIDGEITFNWYGVVTPVALRFTSSILYRFQVSRVMNYVDQRTSRRMYWGLLGTTILNGLLILTTYLIAGYLEEDYDYDLVYAFIPVYFVLAYFFFASIFTTVYLWRKNRDFIALEERESKERLQRRRDEQQHGFFGAEGLGQHGGDSNMNSRGDGILMAEKEAAPYIGVSDEYANSDGSGAGSRGRRGANNGGDGGNRRGGGAEFAGDTDEEGSSSGDEMCISEATHVSGDEDDHRPYGRGNSIGAISDSTMNATQVPMESEPITDH